MVSFVWIAPATAVAVGVVVSCAAGRATRARSTVLEKVRSALRGGVIERVSERGPRARGRLGELEVTVDLLEDPRHRAQSPKWRVLAVGRFDLERPLEARVGGWQGWIDPWLQLGETLSVPANGGPWFTLHSERPVTEDHPVARALHHQGSNLARGALHARQDLMQAEVEFHPRVEDNRALFAYLDAIAEISEQPPARLMRDPMLERVRREPRPVLETQVTG